MTSAILQSDIDLVERMVAAQQPADKIVSALTRRGLEPARSAELVSAVLCGVKVQPDDAMAAKTKRAAPARHAESRALADEPAQGQTSQAEPAQTQLTQAQPQVSRKVEKKSPPGIDPTPGARPNPPRFPRIALAALGFLAIGACAAILLTKTSRNQSDLRPEIGKRQGQTGSSAANAVQGTASENLMLEIRPDGLLVCGRPASSTNVLETLTKLLGPPTRVHHLDDQNAAKSIYAYDKQGLLYYSQPGAGADCIVIDFDAVGGTNGATTPFPGTLKIGHAAIPAQTDRNALVAIKELGISDPGADVGILRSRYNNFELYFAYLKNPRRLSLVEINLR
jgi:hypothetical protein